VGSVEGKGKRYGVEIARKVEVCWSPPARTVSRLELGLEVAFSRTLCSLAKEEERDASVYHALSTGGTFGLLGGSLGEVWATSEKIGEMGEIGEVGGSSLSGHGVEGVPRRTLVASQLIVGREREANTPLIFRQKVARRRGDLG